jgi:hypothetical protein
MEARLTKHKHEVAGKAIKIGGKASPVAHVILSKGIRPKSTYLIDGDVQGIIFAQSDVEIDKIVLENIEIKEDKK